MNVTPSGYVCSRPDILAALREEAARTPAHRQFTETAITAFEEDGPGRTAAARLPGVESPSDLRRGRRSLRPGRPRRA
jgi:hypothetical protein